MKIEAHKATIHHLSSFKPEVKNPVEPSHYKQYGVECIDVAEQFDFLIGNVIKYCWRAGHKDDAILDLEKAKWYLERKIQKLKEQK